MEDDVRTSYEAVCSELNIDEGAKDSAWQEYQAINNDYVLEGPHIEWLACALYIACRSSVTQTIEGNDYTGNSISLTQILRATKLRLVEFFRKIKKWLEMARLPPVYLEKVEALERKFEVISVIFNKYSTEFSMLFAPRDHSQRPSSGSGGSSSRPRSRKPNKAKPCTSSQLFEFGWVLYIHIKNQFPLISDDLVNSHYLLLCCLDMLCAAVITMKRKDLLNSSFDGFPEDYDSPSFPQSLEFTWVLSELCKKFAAIEKECLVVRDYYWWPSVRRLYETRSLQWAGSVATIERRDVLQSLLGPNSFHSNLKTLNHVYELMVLQEGDFDERIFLNSPCDVECYNHEQRESTTDGMDSDSVPPGIIYQSPQHLQYGTPLTGREYLSSKDSKLTPVSDANQSVIQLHLLLEGCSHTLPSELVKMCSCCQDSPVSTIDSRLQSMSQKFLHSLKADSVVTPDNFALVRLQLSQSLYYKLLTAIVSHEEKKMAGSSQMKSIAIQNMLEHEVFQQSLFALCVEIVLFSYNSHSRIFPWILDVIEVNPFHFYKVIEVAIKVEHGFPRTVIKHLSKIEESVLSSLAWKTSSPLYELLDKVVSIPCYADVALPESPITGINSPVTSRLKMSATKDNPSPLSVRERYSSPVPSVSRRQLFTGKRPPKSPTASPLKTPHPIAPKPPQGKVRVTRINPITNTAAAATAALINLIQQTSPQKADPLVALQAILAQSSPDKKQPIQQPIKEEVKSATDGQENNLPPPKITVTDTPQKSTLSPLCPRPLPQPKRTGSVALFYRKVYQMSFLRIKDLCERLNLETEMLQKAWTCFEYSLMRSADLMRDRHIDQLIMCSIYVVAKVLRKEVTFQEIMRQYRHQPQAKSHVYRSVLLNNGRSRKPSPSTNTPQADCEESMDTTVDSSTANETDAPPTSTAPAIDTKAAVAKDSSEVLDAILFKDDIEEGARGDIIQFYNKIFIGFVKDYVLKFTPDEGGPSCSMSPLPLIKRAPVSPRKLSKNHQIFVSPLKGSNQSSMSPLAKTFVISKSPASDLHELNQVVGSSGLSGGGPRLMGARRQLDALLSRSPSSLIQRPIGNTTEGTVSRHIPPSISRIQTQHEPMNTETNTSTISSRTCNGDSNNSIVVTATTSIQNSGSSNNHV